MLVPELTGFRYRFNARLWREMLAYSARFWLAGVAGIMNQTIDKIIFPSLVSDPAEAMSQLGIYRANYKIAIVMVMFTQAFRFAYEPFIFAKNKESGGRGYVPTVMPCEVFCGVFDGDFPRGDVLSGYSQASDFRTLLQWP